VKRASTNSNMTGEQRQEHSAIPAPVCEINHASTQKSDETRFLIFVGVEPTMALVAGGFRVATGDTYRKVQDQYGKQARQYAVSHTHSRTENLDIILAWSEPERDWRVLDVATGTGFTAFQFAPRVGNVVAFDLTPSMLTEARRLAAARGLSNVLLVAGLAEDLPFQSESFDVVTCRVAAHHFGQVERFLTETARVLRPGGRFYLIDTVAPEDEELDTWMQETETLRDPSHGRNFRAPEWLALVEKAELRPTRHLEMTVGDMLFSDWVTRAGTDPAAVDILRELFRAATMKTTEAFAIEPIAGDREDFRFTWPVLVLEARKASLPPDS
jgi:ubiquinone/menaquinone biosynthesis C-methylase UbiE